MKNYLLAFVAVMLSALSTPATARQSFQGLGDLTGGSFNSRANGVTADGSVVVGFSRGASGIEAFRWTSGGGMVGLGVLSIAAFGVSADGSVVVGTKKPNKQRRAFRWASGGGMLSLGVASVVAYGVSADGSVVVGLGRTFGPEAFRWTNGGGLGGLGDLPGGVFLSQANDVSADGSVVVGSGFSDIGHEAFIWDAANGMQGLQAVMEGQLGLDLTGWTRLHWATGVSDDGATIVGYGTNTDGNTEAWIATLNLPPECPADFNDDGFVNVKDLLVLLASWGACPETGCRADLNGDGFVNVTDLLEFIASRGACPGTGCRADLNGDGFVNVKDLMELLVSRGPCSAGECPADLNDDGFVNAIDVLDLLVAWGACP